ncbi:MAG: PKD domain-containing protein [Flavobacteriales bacterium]|nr:PKD domain-containing protein [Flavobacteriales bacterium]
MYRILPVLLAFGLLAPLHAQPTRVLFIGNSYTGVNNLPEMTRQLALSLGDTLAVASSSPGGYTFQQHSTNAATQGLIDQGNWDFVVLQEQSQLPSFPPSQVASDCLPYAQALVDSIRAHSPCVEPVFYMTWGRQNGDAQNCASWPPVCTYEGMQQQLRQSYLQMSEDNSAACAPAGMAWKRVRAEYPAINLYSSDGSHPTVAGTYLVACTMYSTFFGTSTVGASFISSLDAGTAATLQMVASSVVLDSIDTWNIGVNDPVALPEHEDQGNGNVFFSENSVNATAHSWDLGDGSTSMETSFTHTYTASGTYTVTYVAMDDCGRTDTNTFAVNLSTTGISDLPNERFSLSEQAGVLVLHHANRAGLLELFDLQGRKLAMRAIPAGHQTVLPLPDATVLLWRFQERGGHGDTGVLALPR